VVQKLQENERLKYELSELRSRLDATHATTKSSAEDVQCQTHHLGSETQEMPPDAVSGVTNSFVSAASDSVEGTNCV